MEEETPKRYVVVCDQYTTVPLATKQNAEQLAAQINASGNCSSAHTVKEV